ncbi:MAG: 50S ribosomal protein L9 [Candidatus Omnitrophica bacterium CG08_land_8_20_14_0_20_41_16]|nr:MAG: 50S ribosomal protein L9 [Candidatus Omnitrophica bacterium CG08_land_8_20_14_0_20_41_16]
MEVILTKDVDKIGKSGAVVKVKDGFARNFLMPKGLAIEVTSGNLKKLDEKNQKISLELEKKKGAAEELKARLDNLSLTIPALVEGEESLYGSITALDIYNTLKEEGVELDKDCIILNNPIKALGVYEIPLKLHSQVEAKLKVWVVKK